MIPCCSSGWRFLTGYVLPKAYFEKVGPQGFEAKPIGSGPYVVADIDTGCGNALNVIHAITQYERAGAAAVLGEARPQPKLHQVL